MKRILAACFALLLLAAFAACGAKPEPVSEPEPDPVVTEAPEATEIPAPTEEPEAESKIDLPDGVYTAEFKTDSSMFHVNEANKGMGVLTVKDGRATIHISLVGKSILNLFPGLAEDAQKDGAALLEPTTDTVTYDDGETEEVYGFDVPVPVIGEEFDLALIGKKDKWYDHKVMVLNPVPQN
jgi:predicted small lipoprotein YifL